MITHVCGYTYYNYTYIKYIHDVSTCICKQIYTNIVHTTSTMIILGVLQKLCNHTYKCTYVYIYKHIRVYTCKYMHIYDYTYTYLYVCMNISYAYKYTHGKTRIDLWRRDFRLVRILGNDYTHAEPVYVCVYRFVSCIYIHRYINACKYTLKKCNHVYMHRYICVRIYIYVYICTCIHIHINMYKYVGNCYSTAEPVYTTKNTNIAPV